MAHIAVHVQDPSGNPIQAVDVTVSGQGWNGITDSSGNFDFGDRAPGTYTVQGQKVNYDPTPQSDTKSAPAGASTQFVLVLTPVLLEIVDQSTGTVVSGTTQTKIVGQKVNLTLRTNPAGHSITNVQWTIPDEKVKNYTQSTSAGTRTDLSASDLQAAAIAFFWISGGTKAVQVSASVDGSPEAATVTFNVLAPTGVTMTSVTGAVAVSNPGFPGSGLELHFGTSATPGITSTLTATAPAGGDGQIAGVQLDAPTHQRTLNNGTAQRRNPAGAFLLDTTVPYAPAVGITGGSSATWTSDDTPGLPLDSSLISVTGTASFKLYFMYKPSGADSIWVALARLDWNWTGTTTRVGAPAGPGNNWNPATAVGNSNNPSGSASTELPTWTGNVTGLSWGP